MQKCGSKIKFKKMVFEEKNEISSRMLKKTI